MRRTELVLALVAGLIGGLIIGQTLSGNSALAQKGQKKRSILAAQEFRLLDGDQKTRVSLRVDEKGDFAVSLYDKQGKVSGQFGFSSDGRPSITLGTKSGGKK
jgi:hypothetical protein